MGKAIHQREGAVMILGGGIAGIQAALDLTELGFYVYLVERRQRWVGLWLSLTRPFRPMTVRSESWHQNW